MNTIPKSCDVVVIGGGPSGSLTATYLAQKGYKVVLFEQQKHPRYQVGESLLPDFWKYCDAAGVSEQIKAEGFVEKAGGTVDWNGNINRISFKDFGYTRPALHVERDRFDFILLENARRQGVHVAEEITVLDADFSQVENLTSSVLVNYRRHGENQTENVECRFVADASGQNAVIGKQLGLRVFDEGFRFMSVWGYFENSSYIAANGEIQPASSVREIPPTTYVSALPQGDGWAWMWHIILREATSLGFVVPISWVRETKTNSESWEAWFLKQCGKLPLLQKLLTNAKLSPDSVRLIRNYSYRSTKVAGPGYFLVGDAAGFVDPIFSVGIVFGMYSAFAAAYTLDRCFKETAKQKRHQEIYSHQIQSRLELGRSLALPYYQEPNESAGMAREAIKFADFQAQSLIYAASLLTNRSPNFAKLTDTEQARLSAVDRVHPLEISSK